MGMPFDIFVFGDSHTSGIGSGPFLSAFKRFHPLYAPPHSFRLRPYLKKKQRGSFTSSVTMCRCVLAWDVTPDSSTWPYSLPLILRVFAHLETICINLWLQFTIARAPHGPLGPPCPHAVVTCSSLSGELVCCSAPLHRPLLRVPYAVQPSC